MLWKRPTLRERPPAKTWLQLAIDKATDEEKAPMSTTDDTPTLDHLCYLMAEYGLAEVRLADGTYLRRAVAERVDAPRATGPQRPPIPAVPTAIDQQASLRPVTDLDEVEAMRKKLRAPRLDDVE